MSEYIPLPLFFAKPEKDQLQISPGGTYLGWRARDESTGVLNIWVQRRTVLGTTDRRHCHHYPPPRRITFASDRDACLLFRFTSDDRTVLYIRESRHGSELYHLHAVDLDDNGKGDGDEGDDDSSKTHSAPPSRNLIGDPSTTCAVGFVGGVQLWLDPSRPRRVYVSTATSGPLGLFWDVSSVDVDTAARVVVARNVLSTWTGIARFVLGSLWWLLVRRVSFGRIALTPPRATIQWFPDRHMNFRGRVDVSVVNLNLAFCVQSMEQRREKREGIRSLWPSESCWKVLRTIEWGDTNMSLIGSSGGSGTARADFSEDGKTVDVHLCDVDEKCDTTSYERFDVATGRHVRRLASSPKSDITGFVVHPRTGSVQAVTFEYEKPSMECLVGSGEGREEEKDFKRDVSFLTETFRDGSVSILSRTWNDDVWIVYAENDSGLEMCNGSPSGYFVYERSQQHPPKKEEENCDGPSSRLSRLRLVVNPRPGLSDHRLGTMKPVYATARDGEDILCYLSVPPGSKKGGTAGKGNPLVVLVHGGPQDRDKWRYHPVCQLLCSRGISVLQVNYRGSTGMGTRFMRLGMDGKFYTTVQHDVIDAARHAMASGWADPDRLGIMGGSFGGYSALHAMTFEPGTFRCAVAICSLCSVGAANPSKAFRGSPLVARYWKSVYGEEVWSDRTIAEQASPLFHVRNVSGPMLLLHGEDDPRAPLEHSNRIAEEMKRFRIPGEYVTFAGEGHSIAMENNVIYMFSRIERFLCKHLDLNEPPPLEESWTRGNSAKVRMVNGEALNNSSESNDGKNEIRSDTLKLKSQ